MSMGSGMMQYRKLGTSSFYVSVYAFGAWQIGDSTYWGEDLGHDPASTLAALSGADAAVATVHAAIDAGVNLFDTAEMYGAGESERVLGRALKGRRDKVLIASKVSPANCTPEKLVAACESSLLRLQTDYLDLYQVHWPPRDIPFEDVHATLEHLRDAGKIRKIGVSNFGAQDLDTWFQRGECVSDQIGYNLAFRAPEYDVLPACARHDIGVLAYMPLFQGILACRWDAVEVIPEFRRRTRHFSGDRPRTMHNEAGCEEALLTMLAELKTLAHELDQPTANLALAWLAAQSHVTSVIIGARNAWQLQRNLQAVDLILDATVLRRLDEISMPVKLLLGRNADMWMPEAESRIR